MPVGDRPSDAEPPWLNRRRSAVVRDCVEVWVEGVQVVEANDARGLNRVADLGAAPASPHKPGVSEHLQVLTDRGLSHREYVGEIACAGLGFLSEAAHDS